MMPIMSEPYENACPASPLIREIALLTPLVMADIIPEIVEEILNFIELKAVVAALLMLLLRDDSVDFMAFQPKETTDLMPFTTPEVLLLMAVQMDETVDRIAERTAARTVLIAFHAVLIRIWIPFGSGDRKDTTAFHTVITAVWIAVSRQLKYSLLFCR